MVADLEADFADGCDRRRSQGLGRLRQRSLPEAVTRFDAVARASTARAGSGTRVPLQRNTCSTPGEATFRPISMRTRRMVKFSGVFDNAS